MSNIPSLALSPQQRQFIDDLSELLHPWGMAIGLGRLYAYLLLKAEPTGLDRICEQLEISKSTASVAARELEYSGMIKRHSQRGTKRVLYSIVEDSGIKMAEHAMMIGRFAELLQKNMGHADGVQASQRMQKIAQFNTAMKTALETALTKWSSDR